MLKKHSSFESFIFMESLSSYGIMCIHTPVLLAFLSHGARSFFTGCLPTMTDTTGSYSMVDALLVMT